LAPAGDVVKSIELHRWNWQRSPAVWCDLVRDVVGNPFQPSSGDLLAKFREDRTVNAIAHGIYADQRFMDLPILADALEDAGCTNPTLLDHLRKPGPHVRGCWPVDLALAKV
jgi:hypothetical protein